MPVTSKHPSYTRHEADWELCRDTIEGQTAVKAQGDKYLPIPPGMNEGAEFLENGKRRTNSRYAFYSSFAEFPEIVGPTINGMQGLVHEKPPTVNLPESLEYLIENATADGMTLADFWEQVTRELLTTGRYEVLVDIGTDDNVYLAGYNAESLINWREIPRNKGGGASLAVLGETVLEPKEEDPYVLEPVNYYRELRLSEESGSYEVILWKEVDNKLVEVQDEDGEAIRQPSFMGKALDFIPITVMNSNGMGFGFGSIPILPMARRSISIYRRTADYNRSLYIKGDPQLVLFGVQEEDAPDEIGGGSVWAFENPEGKAMYVDIDGKGIPLVKGAIDDDYVRFYQEAGRILDSSDSGAESGEAIRRRQNQAQVTLKSLVINAGQAIEFVLKTIAEIRGLPQEVIDEIDFQPNTDFAEASITGQELLQLVTAKNQGAPLSLESLHRIMQRRNVTDKTFEEELEALGEEGPDLGMAGRDAEDEEEEDLENEDDIVEEEDNEDEL